MHRQLVESSSRTAPRSFDPTYYATLFSIEERHFWFRTRNEVIASLVSQITDSLATGYRVLEVGCGTGNVLGILERTCSRGTVIGMDLFSEGLQYARLRTSGPLLQGDVRLSPFGSQFELVGLFDVLEHLDDDIGVLLDLNAMLTPGGTLLLTVPAHPSLWSYFDEASCHCRRYEPKELGNKLARTGYQVDYLTQYMASIFPLVWFGRRVAALVSQVRGGHMNHTRNQVVDELSILPVVNDILIWLLAQESRVIAQRRQIPVGTSMIAIARRNS